MSAALVQGADKWKRQGTGSVEAARTACFRFHCYGTEACYLETSHCMQVLTVLQ